ncbi:hypothetical protein BS78_05G240300 [Paspalum vaginatum]|nr:hypothetical protein BS78_05G240300 [Paspalum vaginatum]
MWMQIQATVKPETLKLIVPQSTNKGFKLVTPFSDAHSSLTLNEAAIGRMIGAYDDGTEEISDNDKMLGPADNWI